MLSMRNGLVAYMLDEKGSKAIELIEKAISVYPKENDIKDKKYGEKTIKVNLKFCAAQQHALWAKHKIIKFY